MKPNKSNYDIQCDRALQQFVTLEHEELIRKFTLDSDANYLYINLVKQKYRFHRTEATVEKSNDGVDYFFGANFNELAPMFDLFTYSKDNLRLSGEWANVWNIETSIQVGHSSNSPFLKKYEDYIAGRIHEFEKACTILGGEKVDYADSTFIINTFDFLPVMVQVWDADEEFSARIRLLWDKNILDYIRFETTFSLEFHLFDRIIEIMKS